MPRWAVKKKNKAGIHSPDGQKEKKKKKLKQVSEAPLGMGKKLNAGIRGPDGPRNTAFFGKKTGIHGPDGLRRRKKE